MKEYDKINDVNYLVSVIIPTYKGSKNICRALRSIENQSYPNIEVIIVDDNGKKTDEQIKTETTIKAVKWNFNYKYIVHEINKNGAVARNTGIKLAKGNYICFLDDDDVYFPEKIKLSVECLEENKDIDACFSGVLLRRNEKFVDYIIPRKSENIQKELMFNGSMFGTGSNIFVRASVLRAVNGFDERYIRHQDLEFLLRVFEKFKYIVIPDILIIKDNDSFVNNIPKYWKMKETKAMYYNDFKFIIDRWSNKEQNDYYMQECASLLKDCFGVENKESIFDAVVNIKKYRKLTLKERLGVLLTGIKVKDKNIYYYLRSIYVKLLKRNLNLNFDILDKANKLINIYDDNKKKSVQTI
ncbi:glycosyltransferase family 2 protein [Clostridium butyricum]|uniref:glycosyltransferase family 2 protein n=1 Tax=Clostridium butyricum TaxID=1492 RepID=UPI001CA8751D|nr:glycosyltransferase family A protein [Clostridium butyricum]MBZ0312024.1 glycosyltransferase family 2 protein [Clostridium butyricum]